MAPVGSEPYCETNGRCDHVTTDLRSGPRESFVAAEEAGGSHRCRRWIKLAEQNRRMAETLRATGEEMAGYRAADGQPRPGGDGVSTTRPDVAHLIDVERELRELLDERLERDMRLLSTSCTRAS